MHNIKLSVEVCRFGGAVVFTRATAHGRRTLPRAASNDDEAGDDQVDELRKRKMASFALQCPRLADAGQLEYTYSRSGDLSVLH